MKPSAIVFHCLLVASVACGTAGGAGPLTDSGSASRTESGSSSGSSSGAASADTGAGGMGSSSGAPSGSSSGAASDASSDATTSSVPFDGGANMVPAGYAGVPFKKLTIPGTIYVADYDTGGPGVAFCHSDATGAVACANGINLNDWCCSGTGAQPKGRCNEPTTVCPFYRQANDNAGLSHMNLGEPDKYATTGPTWAPGPNGPTLTGPMVMAGDPVPQHATTTTVDDVYLSYLHTGQWSKYTVEVLLAGTYSVGGLMGAPGAAGTVGAPGIAQFSLDFGGSIATGPLTPLNSETRAGGCPESYHCWQIMSNLGTVTIPAPGTYVMTFKLLVKQFNPLYFTFTKM